MHNEFNAKKHEFLGVILLLAALLVFLCLVSYNSGDASFNTLSLKPASENKIGPLGAYTSDLLYQIFGFAAFLLLAPLLVIGWKLISGRKIHAKYLKVCGFLLLISSAAAAFQLFPFGPENPAFMPGGVTGLLLSDFLLKNLNRTGTVIVIAGALLLGILATTPWSLSRSFSRFSSIPDPDPPKPGLIERFRLWREKRKARRIKTVNIRPATTVMLDLSPKPIQVKPHHAPGSVIPASRETGDESNAAHAPDETTKPRSGRLRNFKLPPVNLLNTGEDAPPVDETELVERAKMLADKCAEFDATGNITQIHPGPVVTTFEFKPDPGVKYSRITGLVDDLCLGIKAESLRIDRIPGKATIGIEVPNPNRETIMLRDLVESDAFTRAGRACDKQMRHF